MTPSIHSHAPLAAEARPRRRGDPLLGAIAGVIALIGVGVVFLAVHDGHVTSAGPMPVLGHDAAEVGPAGKGS